MMEYDVTIIENEEQEYELTRMGWGHSEDWIGNKHIQALLDGHKIGFFDGEYTHTIKLVDTEKLTLVKEIQFLKSIISMDEESLEKFRKEWEGVTNDGICNHPIIESK